MIGHLNLRLRKQDAAGGHAGVSLHLGRPDEPAAYAGLVEVEVAGGLGVAVRCAEDGGATTLSLWGDGRRLDLDPEEFRLLLRRRAAGPS